jgi:hypothetical protein
MKFLTQTREAYLKKYSEELTCPMTTRAAQIYDELQDQVNYEASRIAKNADLNLFSKNFTETLAVSVHRIQNSANRIKRLQFEQARIQRLVERALRLESFVVAFAQFKQQVTIDILSHVRYGTTTEEDQRLLQLVDELERDVINAENEVS